ncbi:hypothetical protein [Methylobacterium sp. yr596]|uniref:hypothetical protein n=1 Tax=Methylobacterium sp. yr596 TaxID=1761800 RepID=UPI0008E8645F|nr:hypothetical protein [Methylobacterium sp. yr596]SFE20148.1 hypothetical protein SAMN04487844_101403 [Methylobacterium sp. yr596]
MTNWAKKLAELVAATVKMVMAALAALLGLDNHGLGAATKRAGAAARAVASGTADGLAAAGRAAGHGLTGPLRALDLAADAVGQTLGALLPRPPVTAKAVADAAVERDETRIQHVDPENNPAQAALVASNLVGIRIQSAASSLQRRPGELHDIYRDDLTPPVTAWLEGLSPAQLQAVINAPSYALDRHVNARSRGDLLPGVPRVLSSTARLARAVAEVDVGPAAVEEMMARARANMRGDRAEVAAMMKRGAPRLPPETSEEPEAGGPVAPPRGPRPGYRPSFH